MSSLNQPLFCLTADVDWASDYAIQDLLGLVQAYDITPTFFATHPSEVLSTAHTEGTIRLGIHPNFLPGSSHGSDHLSVIDHMCETFPTARSFRSHCFADGTHITRELARRGYLYDSNLCLYLQPDLVPLQHESGLVRMPVFWEDDTHWTRSDGDWDLERYLATFLTPGLKVLNVHPFMVAANIRDQAHFESVHSHITTLGPDTVDEVRHPGPGVRTFLLELLEVLARRREHFYTLDELYEILPVAGPVAATDPDAGRQSVHTDEDHRRYWSADPAERQELLKQSYSQRNPTDVYATSRDHNVRELEIESIRSQLGERGRVIDLGCGNGYSLLSLARGLDGWELVGVDFSESLIDGAAELRDDAGPELRSVPEFVCADAVAYIRACPPESARYVITERFLLNLPTPDLQKEVIQEAYRVLVPGGRLLMCEGSQNGFDGLNDARASVCLDLIPATSKDNITSIRFKDEEVEDFARELGYVAREKLGFSTYFLMTRVLHPLLAAPLPPRFDAPINGLAARIQGSTPAQPGYGANVLWVFEKPDVVG